MTTQSLPSRLESVCIDPNNGDLIKKYKLDDKTTVSKIVDSDFVRSGSGTEYAPGQFILKNIYSKGSEIVTICDLRPQTDLCCYIKIKALVINLTDMISCQHITHKYYVKCINSKVFIQKIDSKIDFMDGIMNIGINVYISGDSITFAAIGIENNVLKWDTKISQVQNDFTFEPTYPPKTPSDVPQSSSPAVSEVASEVASKVASEVASKVASEVGISSKKTENDVAEV